MLVFNRLTQTYGSVQGWGYNWYHLKFGTLATDQSVSLQSVTVACAEFISQN